MIKDVKLYTIRRLATNIALLEEHLKEYSQGEEELFCLDCETKHVLLTLGFSEECIGFKCEPENLIRKIKNWAEDLLSGLSKLSREEAINVVKQAREFRKQLEGQILGSDGHLKEG